MRAREALRLATKFVTEHYGDTGDGHGGYDMRSGDVSIEVALEHDGERRKSWSFGVRIDEEATGYDPDAEIPVGYVHADGRVTGLY